MDERLTKAETIVFDVGNVLLRFDPERVLCLLPEDMRAPLRRALFDPCRLWHEFDRGLEDNASIARRAAAAAGFEGQEDSVLSLLTLFPETLTPLPLYHLLPRLGAMGRRLYGLTNYPEPSFSITCRLFPALTEELQGIAVSSREKLFKPQPAFFRLLMERYGIDPHRALFIDDNADNIAAAQALGFAVWHYAGEDTLLPTESAAFFDEAGNKSPG